MKKTIYIYANIGTSEESVKQTFYTFQDRLGKDYALSPNTAKEIAEDPWQQDAFMLIIPGGADIPYKRRLEGEGNEKIKEYIRSGGRYLGICAGSYYASGSISFTRISGGVIAGERELSFFPGTTEGPTLAPYCHRTNSGSRIAKLQWVAPGESKVSLYSFLMEEDILSMLLILKTPLF